MSFRSLPRLILLVAMLFLVAPMTAGADSQPSGDPPPRPFDDDAPPPPWSRVPEDPPPSLRPEDPPPPPQVAPEPEPEPEPVPTSAERVVYSNDFENTVGMEWSMPITDTAPNGSQRFLGQFGNDAPTLSLEKLPAHQSVMVTFDLYIIRTWDGHWGDFWELSLADGRTLIKTTFSNMHEDRHRQAYPDWSPGGNHPARTGGHLWNSLGYRHGERARDTVYRLAFSFDHAEDVLGLIFTGSGLQELGDESWGLDNVRVIVRDDAAARSAQDSRPLKFDGTDDYIAIPSSPTLDLRGSLTLEARVRCDGDTDGQVIWRGDERSGHDPYELHVHEGRMEFRVDADFRGSHREFAVRSKEPIDKEWHFWTGVYDKDVGMLSLYKDGVLEAEEEIFGVITYDTASMWNMIGAVDKGTWQHLKGAIGEVRVWSVARSPEEVRRDMTRTLTGKEKGLAACWRFGPKTCQIARDISPNQNHGVLGGTAFPDDADPAHEK